MELMGVELGGPNRPFIIAEISGNHGGQIENAFRLIKAAKDAGADAVKTQCYSADSMTLDCKKIDFIIQDGLWAGESLYNIYQKASTPPEWHPDLYQYAADIGIKIFSSVFNVLDLDLLERLNCPAYKIASFEIVDIPLIECASSIGKPMILSTGMASNKEVLDAADALGSTPACFLHCTSDYPSPIEGAGLGRINGLGVLLEYRYPIGLSDHTDDFIVPIAATAKRAAIIEKHLKLPDVEAYDDKFSLVPEDFETMVESIKLIHQGCNYTPQARGACYQFRRSLYAVSDIAVGDVFNMSNIRSIRPSFGAPPRMLPDLLGTAASKSYKRGDPIR